MWNLETQSLAPGVIGAAVLTGNARMTFSQVISLWRSDETFAAEWTAQLAAIPFNAGLGVPWFHVRLDTRPSHSWNGESNRMSTADGLL
jgi:hypothetical protein